MTTTRVINSFLLFALTSITTLAQQISFKSEADRNQVSLGEAFSVGFFIESNTDSYSIDRPMKYPDHKGLQVVGEQRSQNISYVNGKGVIEDGIILSFVAEKEGKYQIGAAKIVINGKTYASKPINVTVKEAGMAHSNFRRSGVNQQPVFLESKVSKTNPYVNEQVGLSVKLYAKDLSYLNRKQNFRQGNLDGLSPKIVKSSPENIKQEIVAGKQYFSEEIARYYVFPQKPGKIEIDPFSVDVILPSTYGIEPVEVRSNSVTITAKALPEEGKPKNFNGAVGQFKLNTSVDKKELSTNESVNYDVEVVGSGNFNSINLPEVKTPKEIEKFSPKKRDAFKTYDEGMKGKVAEQTVLVPNSEGSYTISPVEFSYFDPVKEQYVTLKSDSVNLKVNQSEDSENSKSTEIAKTSGNSSSFSDMIENVNDNKQWLLFTGSLVSIVALGFFFFRKKKKSGEINNDVEEEIIKPINESLDHSTNDKFKPQKQKFVIVEKSEISDDLIIQDLEELEQKINTDDPKEFYKLQEKILSNVAMKKTNTDLAHFSEDLITNKLTNTAIDTEIISQWKLLFSNAQKAKYAFGGLNQDLEDVYQETVLIVEELMSK
ncbi:BatD family protein [Chishuiella sp.]|uniref:BatD family protein n=1 Tax=Chishuiella sp. TaxID=1969467 RepID=UPI0028AE3F89|nr:BatD family protein [Chishuiella sp.]